ncbi:Na+/H+ antiporter NhaC family protein [Paraglaciecola sp. MB-3u-78]|uniref:Na+/H+ antiporter NhaC family protein n=1 Tax=Paraglaciecola sp. MB-3u-78 TaxID=2058332 RepID=UPI000C347FC8|nr:Na+/H+ antiporter NhaC family protein [Paraglaciecola sp. MB-3u-78]PKG93290.1 sodium:proton antiporter [Paraglaciecola sp. MB-3u-78]
MQKPPKGHFLGLTPILLFMLLVIGSGVLTQNFSTMPILVAFAISAGFALLLNNTTSSLSIAEKVDIFCRGGGDKTIILLAIIFLLAGAFYAVTIDIGARDATVNWALNYVPTAYLLPGLFVITSFIAFAMGTSMGTITAITPIGIGLAESLGVPIPLAVGIVIGGAMFGDNLSFISDTTIAATRTQGVQLRDKFKANLIIVLPAACLTALLLMFVDIDGSAVITSNDYDGWLILPYLLIIGCALSGVNVIGVLGIGIGSACIIGLTKGLFTLPSMLQSIQKGMGWMQDMVAIALMIGGIVALMKAYGGMQWLVSNITKRITTKKGAEYGTAVLVSALDIATANNTIAIVSTGPIAKDLGEQYDLDPRRTASLLDIFSCGFQGLVPYGGQLLVAASLAGLSPLALTPYCWYPMLILVFGIIAIATGLPKFKDKSKDDFS